MTITDSNTARLDIAARSAVLLEWPAVLAQLAGHAATPTGKERCLHLTGSDDRSTVEGWYAEVREWLVLHDQAGDLPLAAGADPRSALHAAVEGGLLEAGQCREIALVLDQTRDVRRVLGGHPALGRLAERARRLDDLPELRRAIEDAVDPQGNLRETATPELSRLRREVDRLRLSIVERVEGLLRSPMYEPWLQDTFVTQREDRYVLPIKIENRAKVRGIVHDLSASGATVFVEPEELVEVNNELKWAELAMSQEIERIFRRLTDLTARHRSVIEINLDVLTDLDVIQAKGRLGLAYRGSIPAVVADGAIAWRGLRHPLLALRGVAVVPNDVMVAPGIRAVVISGPNTGGKTVLLKAMGLAALMTRSGIPLPCAPDSTAPLFPAVMTEVGDDQDLARDLSTFAGHIRVIAAMIETTPPGGLVLIDELATATDPDEGAALAQAVLEQLMAKHALAVVTTHYTALKAWAAGGLPAGETGADRLSAGMGYDADALVPTYRLALGRPGASLGLDVAARLGLPASVLERAKHLVAPQTAALERAIAALEAERQTVASTHARLSALETAAREAALRQDAAAAAIERERDDFAATRKARIAAEVDRAKREIDRLLETAQREHEPKRLRVLRAEIDRVAVPARTTLDEAESDAPAPDLPAGARVRIPSLKADGVLLDDTRGRRRVRVRVGDREISLAPSALKPLLPSETTDYAGSESLARGGVPVAPTAVAETVDLLGRRVEDALDRIDRALDQAMAAGATRLRLLHGHGTGRLKTAIRAHLAASPYVASHRPGEDAEGGDAVTIVTLAISS